AGAWSWDKTWDEANMRCLLDRLVEHQEESTEGQCRTGLYLLPSFYRRRLQKRNASTTRPGIQTANLRNALLFLKSMAGIPKYVTGHSVMA
ncbi:hypothetical protein Tco_0146957, partial [Tanacetum coccineum]